MLLRPLCRSRRPPAVRETPPPPASPRLGGLCQARFRWSPAGVALSRSLHPPRGHFQSSFVDLRSGPGELPLEGLRSRKQTRPNDAGGNRVSTPLLSARASQRLRPHPSLRVSRQSLSRLSPGAMPTTAGLQLLDAARRQIQRSPFRQFFSLALPALRRNHDRHSQIYSRGTINMCVLRFFLATPSVTTLGCAPARRGTRVSTFSRLRLCQLSIASVYRSTDDPNRASDPTLLSHRAA